MVNYNNARLYTIRSPYTKKFYIGSTCNSFTKRLSQHKNNYKTYLMNDKPKRLFVSVFDIFDCGDVYIELLKICPCENKMQLHKIEGETIRKHKKDCVNMRIAGRTNKEYGEEHKVHLKEKAKEYRQKNKETLGIKHKNYREQNKEHLNEYLKNYREQNKEEIKTKQKDYYKNNSDKVLNRVNEYRQKNKERIKEYTKEYKLKNKERLKERFICECGESVALGNKSRHNKSKLHLNNIKKE
jgi:hypothetical protein